MKAWPAVLSQSIRMNSQGKVLARQVVHSAISDFLRRVGARPRFEINGDEVLFAKAIDMMIDEISELTASSRKDKSKKSKKGKVEPILPKAKVKSVETEASNNTDKPKNDQKA